ncbi:anthranilate synthase component II [Aureispira anguillae]|uniref:Aminodeoxychorismate/anthranilate synthase component II n=1 Tax=Aureispira anguillae TaxID=2864201 RepID=A0A916DWB1_9BACT|nr:aminodeoxychorismate/anthranilate synthase component II [Aureispira anguillae]BDS14485.1 aminodeoxychorismate/anthranilate synthase component II [Aureispira anguillae]
MRLLIIDNYDSFTYNLVQYLREICTGTIEVYRNDQIQLEDIDAYDTIVLSPGPGLPEDAGMLLDIIKTYTGRKPILGVCLGHQAIGQVFGAELKNIENVYHGVATPIHILNHQGIFEGQEHQITVGRYHSWVVDPNSLPDCLEILAEDEHGQIMALQHKTQLTVGMQFHPESVLTPQGKALLSNFIKIAINQPVQY